MTRDVRICLYRQTVQMRFEAGKLAAVTDEGFTTWHEEPIRFPPHQFTQLVLGYRTWRELKASYPDVDVQAETRALVDVLFPKMTSFTYTQY